MPWKFRYQKGKCLYRYLNFSGKHSATYQLMHTFCSSTFDKLVRLPLCRRMKYVVSFKINYHQEHKLMYPFIDGISVLPTSLYQHSSILLLLTNKMLVWLVNILFRWECLSTTRSTIFPGFLSGTTWRRRRLFQSHQNDLTVSKFNTLEDGWVRKCLDIFTLPYIKVTLSILLILS